MMIYLISDGEVYKIGRSNNPEKRLKQLQTGNGKNLRLIAIFEYTDNGRITEKVMERRLHYILRQFRIRRKGEWFKFPPTEIDKIIDIIQEIMG